MTIKKEKSFVVQVFCSRGDIHVYVMRDMNRISSFINPSVSMIILSSRMLL